MRSRHSTWIQWESNYVIGWLACFVTCPRQPISYWCKHWCKSTDKQGDDLNRHRIPSPFTDTCWLCHVSEYKFQFILIEDTNPPCMITVNSTTQCNFTPLLLLSVGCLWWAGWYWLPSVCLFVWVLQSTHPVSKHMWGGDIAIRRDSSPLPYSWVLQYGLISKVYYNIRIRLTPFRGEHVASQIAKHGGGQRNRERIREHQSQRHNLIFTLPLQVFWLRALFVNAQFIWNVYSSHRAIHFSRIILCMFYGTCHSEVRDCLHAV